MAFQFLERVTLKQLYKSMLISSLYSRFLGYSLRIWNILAEMLKTLWFDLVRVTMTSN